MYDINVRKEYTFKRPNTSPSILDYVLVSFLRNHSYEVVPNYSDHKAIVVTFSLTLTEKEKKKIQMKIPLKANSLLNCQLAE